MICKYCRKGCKNDNSLRNHERLCKSNPNRQIINNGVSNLIAYNNKIKNGEIVKSYSNQYTKALALDLSKPIVSFKTRYKISQKVKGKKWTDEMKQKHSIAMQKAVIEHQDSYTKKNVVGRVKNIEYNGTILKGSWELIVAKYMDDNNIKWTTDITPFTYSWNGKNHLYYPDFYLPELEIYVEVKGYERDRDLAKWKVVNNLVVVKQHDINKMKNGTFRLVDL